jgi:hypothetical protein
MLISAQPTMIVIPDGLKRFHLLQRRSAWNWSKPEARWLLETYLIPRPRRFGRQLMPHRLILLRSAPKPAFSCG